MTNRGTWTSTPTSSGKVTIPAGYHNGSGYVDTSKVYSAGTSAGGWKYKDITYSASVCADPGYKDTTIAAGVTVKGAGILTCSITKDDRGGHQAKITNMTWSGSNVVITMYSSTNYQTWTATGKMRIWY